MTRRTPYRERIQDYCARNQIDLPPTFDRPKSSERFVVIDETARPAIACNSTYRVKDVIEFLLLPVNASRKLRVLDFKRCCEVHYNGVGKLVRGSAFDGLSAEEKRQEEWRRRAST
jgi:hypothetical protein